MILCLTFKLIFSTVFYPLLQISQSRVMFVLRSVLGSCVAMEFRPEFPNNNCKIHIKLLTLVGNAGEIAAKPVLNTNTRT